MAINFLGATRYLPDLISYTPKANCGQRQFVISRAESKLGQTSIKPLIMCDVEFWNGTQYPDIISAIVSSGSGDWSSPSASGAYTGHSQGIASGKWDTIKGIPYRNAEMVGAMLVRMTYGGTSDYIITAAPNLLYNSNNRLYRVHPNRGDNNGTQVHSEMTMAAQLSALLQVMKNYQETPKNSNTPRPGLSVYPVLIDVDIFIEKGSMCQGCQGTWNQTFSINTTYRVAS